MDEKLLTDHDVCMMFDIKPRTLRNHLLCGPPTKRDPNSVDLRKARRVTVFGKRRWLKSSLDELIQDTASQSITT